MIILYLLIAVLVILAAVVIGRTVKFKAPAGEKKETQSVEYDSDKAVSNLQALVRCRTVSYYDHSLEDNAEFDKLIGLLPELYPNFWKTCPLTRFDGRGLLFKWEGKKHDEASVMMAHYDVVPVNESGWTKPPFDALIDENGIMWGRGTLDTKNTFNASLTAADHLIAKGFVPEHDVYFAYSGGEEINGEGAVNIVNWFSEQGIRPALVLDEGGAVVQDVFPGVKRPCGMVGIAEKGMMNVKFTAKSAGGHASAPKPGSPLVRLSRAAVKLEEHPFKYHMTKPAAEMFNTLGRHSSFLYRMIFANFWLFGGLFDMICKKGGGTINALMRTTVALTQSKGSSAPNVIPPEAEMIANLRLNPEDSIASAKEYLRKVIDDDSISIEVGDSMEPSPISETDCEAWNKVAESVSETWDGCIVSPYLMVQCSDSRHYKDISNHVYKFSVADMTADQLESIHGNDEHISVSTVRKASEFYIRLLSRC